MKTVLNQFGGGLLSFCLLLLVVSFTTATAQTLTSNQQDYPPGATVTLSGSGYWSGEMVTLQVLHADNSAGDNNNSVAHLPWYISADNEGSFIASWIIPINEDEAGATLIASADGQSSALHAEVTFMDGNSAADIDQARNGAPDAVVSPIDWTNGNAGSSNSHYVEGYSMPYRITCTNLNPGTHALDIEWDIKHQGANAFDFITTYNRLEPHITQWGHVAEAVDPLIGTGLVSPSVVTFPIPAPVINSTFQTVDGLPQPITRFNSLPAGEKLMTMYNGTAITSLTYITNADGMIGGDLTLAESTCRMRITFTTSNPTVVFAWGGHIAMALDWGDGNSASGISGSPYHTRLIALDGSGGNQDRSMDAGAVYAPVCNIIGNSVLCSGNTLTNSGPTGTDFTYLWEVINNNTGASISGLNTNQSVDVFVGNTGGTFGLQITVTSGIYSSTCFITVDVPPALSSNDTVTNVTITNGNDGIIDLTVSGGTPPYSFLWNDGVTTEDRSGLPIGSYTVTITDHNGCSIEKTFAIEQPPCDLAISGTTSDVTCNGSANGSIDVTVSGSQGEVSYAWNDGATTEDRSGLSGGTYTITATDAGNCTASQSFIVSEPPLLEVSGVVSNVTITNGIDGSIDLTITGGTEAFTFLWNDGVTTEDRSNLAAGTYTVTVTDHNGCVAQQTFTLSEPPCTIAIEGVITDVTCNGSSNGSIDVTVSGSQGEVSYAWNDGTTTEDRSGVSGGTYMVTATDAGLCSVTKTFTVYEPDALAMNVTISMVTIFNGADGSIDVTVSGGTPPYSYLWEDGATTEDRTSLSAGDYFLYVTDAQGCGIEQDVTITQPECNCVAPLIISIDSVCGNNASMCWTTVECATGYIVRWREVPSQDWITESFTAGETCRAFTNHPGAVDEIQMGAICEDGSTVYGDIITWTNYTVCSTPANLITSNITATSADLSWTASEGASKYTVFYKLGSVKTTVKTNNTSITLNGLQPDSKYSWKVKARCKFCGTNNWGAYTPLVKFTTLSLREAIITEQRQPEFTVYPNPTSDNLHITFDMGYDTNAGYVLQVSNLLGQVTLEQRGTMVNGQVETDKVFESTDASGFYLVKMIADEQVFTKQVLLQR